MGIRTMGTMENGRTTIRNLMKVEKYLQELRNYGNYRNYEKRKNFYKDFDESREISIGTIYRSCMNYGTFGTFENGKTSLRTLMKVEKNLLELWELCELWAQQLWEL